MAIWGQKSNRWREYCNPLRGLSLQRPMSLLDAGERGEYSDLQWLYHFMEKSDPVIFSVLQRRRAALLDCDWDVRVVAPTGEEQRRDERTTDSHGWTRIGLNCQCGFVPPVRPRTAKKDAKGIGLVPGSV